MIKRFSPRTYPMAIAVVILAVMTYIGGIGCRHTEPEPSTSVLFNDSYRLIVPHTTTAPNIDGLIWQSGSVTTPEAAWNDSFELALDESEGSTSHESVMRGVVDSSNIYLYFEVEDSGFNSADTLIIAFNPNATDTDFHLLTLKPCFVSSACEGATLDNVTIGEFNYYTGTASGGSITWTLQALGSHGITAKAALASTRWSVELAIPRGAPYNFPASDYFGFYANIIETDPDFDPFAGEPFATQHTWPFGFDPDGAGPLPEDTDLPEVTNVITNLPASTVWGHASVDTDIGNGVRIWSSDISTNHGPSEISWNQQNTFYAMAHNNTLNSNNALVTAQDVRATFKWANFGLPSHSSFQKIPSDSAPAAGNPTAYVDIGPTQSHTYQIDWIVPVDDQDFYKDNKHWCIKVELDSTHPDTVFYRSSAQHNMNFAETSSPFTSKATVATAGYKVPKAKTKHEFVLEERFYNTPPELKWASNIEGAQKVSDSARYLLSVARESDARLALSVLPPDAQPPSLAVEVKARADRSAGQPTKIEVKPGQIITVISSEAAADTGRDNGTNSVVLGSWDNFDESRFVVGSAVSLKAPKGARALYLAIGGDKRDQRESEVAYKARVMVTDLKDYHLRANSSIVLNRLNDQRVPLGSNLPTVVYRGKKLTDRTITINKEVFRLYDSVGSFGYIVKGKRGGG